jgi:hypothetical protein
VSNRSLNGDWDVNKCVFIVTRIRGNDVRQEISDLRHFADAGEVSNDIARSRQCKTKF